MDQGTADRVMPLVTGGENPADRPGAGGGSGSRNGGCRDGEFRVFPGGV